MPLGRAALGFLVFASSPAIAQLRTNCPLGWAEPPACDQLDACYERLSASGNFSARTGLCEGGSCVHVSPREYTCACPPGSALSSGDSGKQHRRCCPDPSPCPNGRRVLDDKCRGGSCTCDGVCLPGCDTCRNNGVCVARSVLGEQLMSCQCPTGYSGEDCGIAEFADACDLRPCQNGATCLPMFARRQCQCPPGFGGEDCEVATHDVCLAQYQCHPENTVACHHGGSGTTHCQCAGGFQGARCEDIDTGGGGVDPCQSRPCQNNGRCETVQGTASPIKLVAVGVDSPETNLFTLTVPDTGFTPDSDCNRTRYADGCKFFAAFAPDGQQVRVQVGASVQPYSVVQVPMPRGPARAAAMAATATVSFRCICNPEFIGTFCEVSARSLPLGGLLRPDDVFGDCTRPGFCCAVGGFCSQVFHYATCECREGWTNTPGAGIQDCAVPTGVRHDPERHSPMRPECVRPVLATDGGGSAATHVLPAGEVVGPSSGASSSAGGGGQAGATGSGGGLGAASTVGGAQESMFDLYAGIAMGVLCLILVCCCVRRWHSHSAQNPFSSSEKAVEQLFEMRGSTGDDGFGGGDAQGSIYAT